ncbi:MAG: hypothetical protein ABI647_25070 [Gemmatimonadota bacterium]
MSRSPGDGYPAADQSTDATKSNTLDFSGALQAVRGAIRAADPAFNLLRAETMQELLAGPLARPGVSTLLAPV